MGRLWRVRASTLSRLGRGFAAAAVLGAIALVGSVASAAPPSDAVGSYVVVLRPDVADVGQAADALARANGGTVGFVYEHALRGFSVTVSPQGAAGIAHNPNVAYVEPDQLFTASTQTTPTGIGRILADSNPNIGINGTDDTRVDVDVAVIDTGIDLTHPDLNVAGSINCASGGPFSSSCGAGGADGNGHGTHVAGTIGALDNGTGVVGVAPGARLWAVRVLNNNGSGYTSWIVAGMDWVVAQGNIEVANMSLGGSTSQALDDAANNMANHGIAVAVAAGNSDADASTSSPARAANVLTVSALADFNGVAGGGAASTCRTDQDDTLADFSNWGPAVEVAAPGVCIYSTWLNGGYNTISGTSMASPHAAGALALLASHSPNSAANPIGLSGVQALYGVLETNGNFNWTDDSGDGIKEPLLAVSNTTVFNPVTVAGPGGGGGGGSDTAPTVSITAPADGATVSGSIPVTAAASDDHGVTQVEFFVGNTSIGVGTIGSDGWSATWNTTTVTNGTYALTAKATDTIGQTTTSAPVSVNVNNPVPAIQLTVRAYKVKGDRRADLTWTGATTASVDIYRDGSKINTVPSIPSAYTDTSLGKGSGSATYKVCAAGGTTTCSNAVTVIW